MPGVGTKQDITTNNTPPARVLDLTRLLSRAGKGPLTGVDRVELAYLDHLLAGGVPVFALLRAPMGFLLLNRSGARTLRQRIAGKVQWDAPNLLSRTVRNATHDRRAAITTARNLAVARSPRVGLARLLSRHVPKGFAYLNVGHSNVTDRVFKAVKRAGGEQSAVFVHDTIPLDHPEFQRAGATAEFRNKLACISRHADLVIYNSNQTKQNAEQHFSQFGRIPAGLVSYLGVDLHKSEPAPHPLPIKLPRLYFVIVGTIEPRKNHLLLLDIWRELVATMPAREVPDLIIIGNRGWNNEAVFHRLDQSPAHVCELPNLGDATLIAVLEGACALLFPSFAEGFGLPAAEACALNTPVICSDLPVFREILGDFPVYLAPNDRYHWKITIKQQAKCRMTGNGADEDRRVAADLPTWAEHFKKILSVT